MELPILKEAVVIFGLSIGVIIVCHRFRIPAIIGFLLTGVLAGPHGLGLVSAAHEVEVLAEIGVILLLFVIGMELSFKELLRLKKPVFLGGAAQVLLTIIVFDGLSMLLGASAGHAVFAGFLAALSSTAVVLKLLSERAELDAPHGRIALGILIFQDIVVVPMMLLIPFLSGRAGNLGASLMLLAIKTVVIILILWVLAKWVIPRVLLMVVRTRSRELFLMTTLGLCFSVAMLTSAVGLSLSLGAFLAGLLMSESEYSLSALEGILPFRDVFTSVFFVSIGMLLDMGYFIDNLGVVVLVTLAVLVVKSVLATGAGLVLGYPLRVTVQAGLALGQIGEFSFVLAGVGVSYGLLAGSEYQLFLAAAIMTMALTPFLIMAAPRVSAFLARKAPLSGGPLVPAGTECETETLSDHLVIVGFGVGGRHLARAAQMAGIRYVIVEMNPDTVRNEAAKGEPIFYGDAAQPAVMEHAGLSRARILAVVIADPAAIRRITEAARKANPALRIVVRTRFVAEIEPLKALGANEVIPEEFETSVEIFTRVLSAYLVPRRDIERFTFDVRAEGYGLLRKPGLAREPYCDLSGVCSGFEVTALKVDAGSFLDGKNLKEAELRKTHGLTLVAINREGKMIANPGAGFRLQGGDVAYIFGEHAEVLDKAGLFAAAKLEGDRRREEVPA
ncbi:monovalent cation:proton antiporter family protein [Desulfocurvibacter africanus]|uniref:monovalent cation:proton antiporter family protein n=2 Tax=Desulfocurvibacter africanus TaxID=873 RepID=UPI000416A26C|nr:monovalent cation:proton antiporter family protein [Desulfocurvibacter africanus]